MTQWWIIHILGYWGENLKHKTDLSLLFSILLSRLSSLVGIYKKHEYKLNYNLNLVRSCSWTSFPQPEVSRGALILLPSSWEASLGEETKKCLPGSQSLPWKDVCAQAPCTWVCSRQAPTGTGVKPVLPPLRPGSAWAGLWLGMKCLEAHCDCTAKARPPGSWLSSTTTLRSSSATRRNLRLFSYDSKKPNEKTGWDCI